MVILYYRDFNGARIFSGIFTSLRKIRITRLVPCCGAIIDDSHRTLFEWTLRSRWMKAEIGKEVTADPMKKTLETEPRVIEGLIVQVQGKRGKLKTKRIDEK